MLDPTPPVDAAALAQRDTVDGTDEIALSIAIVNANRDVEIAHIEDAGKTRRLVLRFTLPLLPVGAALMLGFDGVLLEAFRLAQKSWT